MSIARLFAGALVAVLLAACGPDWDSVDPSLGGAATTSNTTTGTTTSGTGGSGQTTTTPMCSSASQCPGTDSTCATRTCISGACGVSYATSGTHCGSQGSGRHCDGMGNCN